LREGGDASPAFFGGGELGAQPGALVPGALVPKWKARQKVLRARAYCTLE
jgi:hypothetical protein